MNLISLVWWLLISLGIYSFLIVPIMMELAVDKKQRRESTGKLRIKKNGFIIKNFYLGNIGEKEFFMDAPDNICQLYRGVWLGIFMTLFFSISMFAAVLMLIIVILFASIIGFIPIFSNSGSPYFHSYQRYGKNDEKKFIAPWKILLLITLILEVVFYGKTLMAVRIYVILIETMVIFAVAWVIVQIISKIKKWEFLIATRELLKAKKEKVCLKIVSVEVVEVEK